MVGSDDCFSYDLSAATDRWPLITLFEVMQSLFDRSFASSVVNSALATNIFLVPFVKLKWSQVSFVAGQPLYFITSWPLFAFTHHLVVWWSANKVYPGSRFTKYAVLGDDVLIADKNVALVYASVLDNLGVSISKSKSLISKIGCVEFAKRFLVNQLRLELSPISVRCLSNFFHPYGTYAIRFKYSIKRFSTFCRVGGVGYRSLGRLSNKMSLLQRRRHLMWTRPMLPIELWLGRGRPLNPYIKGHLVRFLRRRLVPRDLQYPPIDLFEQSGMSDFLEWSLVRSWMEEWLRLQQWYCITALDPWVTIGVLLDECPVVQPRWNANRQDQNLVRFGLIWKCLQQVDNLGIDYMPGVICPLGDTERYYIQEWRLYTNILLEQLIGLESLSIVGQDGYAVVDGALVILLE